MAPAGFEFIGNAGVVERLRAKLAGGRLPHSLILTGPPGVGKRTCALWIAQALNCAAPDPMACLRCSACRRIDEGTFPDVIRIGPEGDASQIKIEQIRELRSVLSMEPMEGRASVVVIDPAGSMTPSAANALLKSLEEPPSTAYFFLVTANSQELLPTIRSRSQTYHFSPVGVEEMSRSGVSDPLTLRWAEGSIGRALAADPAQLRASRDQMLSFLEQAIRTNDRSAVADLIGRGSELARDKEGYEDHLHMLALLVRDVLLDKVGLGKSMVNLDVSERIGPLSQAARLEDLVEISETLKFIEVHLKHHLNRQLLTDRLVLAMHPAGSNSP